MADPEVRCQVIIRGPDRWSTSRPCGRPAERDGKCKLHLRVEKNRRMKDREWREKFERGEKIKAEADTLGAALGVHVEAHYSLRSSEYDGRFVVDGDWLRAQVRG